ncbi:molybdopterin-guanine dinucleotide biosynthesis protein A [Aquimarina sp. EL_43]|uniref:molybdenum cofactor guanylyltransferase n=1 Tax=unclassified Aquimarina TaxID=2627091 RepID=UPI0018CB1DE2|nr:MULTISPECIES: molybdenum cofactor guanylyltransferase [unclassified Aquimarina]MBG6131815.1 molybdopterin-guanine dinucleotide biosynthesis protein A [Aquimarina sp. EL_35]MBG6149379.1 molybdopterin-guanine dinucleotide biosynthesis protein A [Aquimarina sp. EL_32]MBG6170358.1 molybdopterin-guanine dinucleotide biosynthesis protein A [Aquimarina sp. EL_43]
MIDPKNITGIILAGGKSSRMGREKGLILLDGKPFIQHSIDVLSPLVNTILIVSSNSDYDAFGVKRVEDIIVESGPLAGLHSGLMHSNTKHNLVISCDVPLVTTEFLKKLLSYEKEDYDIVQFEADGKSIPLIALYKKRCADRCQELLANGERRLRKLISVVKTKTITVLEKERLLVTNMNTIEDLKTITNAIDH